MIFLWILGVLLLLFLMVCLLRVQILAEAHETVTLTLRIGPIHRRLYPSAKPKEAKDAKKQRAEKKPIPKPSFSDIKDACRTLKPALFQALRRTRHGIRIYPLDISVIFGGREDPAGAAELYGYASGVVWTVMPALEQLLTIPDPHIHLDMDFEAEKLQLRGCVGIGIRIGTLLMIALGIAIPTIRWFVKYTKKFNAVNKQPLPESAA